MSNIYESEFYDLSFRTVVNSKNIAKVFTEKTSIEVDSEISFDIEASEKSAINYFATSVIGGILHNLIFRAKKEGIELYDLESKINLQIENPLTILAVRGYEEEPRVRKCDIKVYLYSDIDDEELVNFCNETLKTSLIFNTFKDSIDFNVKFISTL